MKKIAIVLALAAVAASAQAAGFEKEKLNIGIMPGMSIPVGDFADGFKSSLALGVAGEYSLKDDLRAGLEIGYSFKHKLKANDDFYVSVMSISPVIKKLWNKDKFTYFVVGGIGMYHWSIQAIGPNSGNEFGFNFGGGASYQLQEGLMAGLDLRYHTFSDEDDTFSSVMVGARLDYRFK